MLDSDLFSGIFPLMLDFQSIFYAQIACLKKSILPDMFGV